MNLLKFRVWDDNLKQMIYDDFQSLVLGYETGYAQELFATKEPMQFTGLHDKHDNEIYNQDIIQHRQGIDIVHWKTDGWYVGTWTPGNLSDFNNDATICGNACENPEFLQQ